MAELYDADGNLVEGALMPEEVEEKLNEALEDNDVSELKQQIESLNEELIKKEQEIESYVNEDDKTKNLVNLRRKAEAAEKDKKTLEEQINALREEVSGKVSEVEKKITSERFEDAVRSLAGSSKDMEDKIKFYYDNFKGDPKDEKEMKERLQNAYVLATGGQPVNPIGSGAISSGIGSYRTSSKVGKPSPQAKEVGKKLGLSDADWEKYGNK